MDIKTCQSMLLKEVLENTKYPNWCINPEVKSIETATIEWSDKHPINIFSKSHKSYLEMFGNEIPSNNKKMEFQHDSGVKECNANN